MNAIYKIRNVVTDAFYIGSTTNHKLRFDSHRRRLRKGTHQSKKLQAAWDKYGEDCFKFEILEQLKEASELRDVENRWLTAWHGTDTCYNESSDACAPMRGRKHSDEVKAKCVNKVIRKGALHYRFGKTLSDEVKKKIGDTQRGQKKGPRTISEEGRQKIQAAVVAGHYKGHGHPMTESQRNAIIKGVVEITTGQRFDSVTSASEYYGLKMPTVRRSLATKKPLSKGPRKGLQFVYASELVAVTEGLERTKVQKAVNAQASVKAEFDRKAAATREGWKNPETRQRRIDSIKAARNTPESKAKTGAQAKVLWTDEKRAAQSQKMRDIAASPEIKAAKAAALKARWADPEQRALLMAARAKPLLTT